MTLFHKFRSQQSHKEEKKFFTDNHFQNILRLSDVLSNFVFTTSETMYDYN